MTQRKSTQKIGNDIIRIDILDLTWQLYKKRYVTDIVRDRRYHTNVTLADVPTWTRETRRAALGYSLEYCKKIK